MRSLSHHCAPTFPPMYVLQRQEAFEESLQVSAAIFSAIRRCPALARDQRILPPVLLGCCSENHLAARHAFAILADLAMKSPDVVSQVRAEEMFCGAGWLTGILKNNEKEHPCA